MLLLLLAFSVMLSKAFLSLFNHCFVWHACQALSSTANFARCKTLLNAPAVLRHTVWQSPSPVLVHRKDSSQLLQFCQISGRGLCCAAGACGCKPCCQRAFTSTANWGLGARTEVFIGVFFYIDMKVRQWQSQLTITTQSVFSYTLPREWQTWI